MRASETIAIARSPRARAGATRVSQAASPGARAARPRPSVTVTRSRRVLSGSTERFVRLHDVLDERMAHDVSLVEMDEGDAFDVADDLHRLDKPGRAAYGQVDLRDVARDDRLRAEPQAGQEHLHLLRRRVLRFGGDDEGVVQRAAAHERDRRDLNPAPLEQALGALRLDHVLDAVLERPPAGVGPLLYVAGQETHR